MQGETDVERAAAVAAETRDAALRGTASQRERGVVHTPIEVARLLAREADRALVSHLDCSAGLCDPRVSIVDPSCGPGAFLAAVHAVGRGRASRPRALLGMDVDVRALDQARAVLAPLEHDAFPLRLVHSDTLASREAPVELAVVIGNPPWRGRSASRNAASDALLDDFRRDATGVLLPDRKLGVLSDDYVRFVRWAAQHILDAGQGVLALVTNASFLDGPAHRGMRAALLGWFDHVDVLDLGGSALVARRAGADESVFGVRVATALTVAVRTRKSPRSPGTLRTGTLRGSRETKLAALATESFDTLLATSVPVAPRFVFRATRDPGRAYASWVPLDALFPFHAEGVQTNRDEACIDVDREALLTRLRAFVDGNGDDPRLRSARSASAHYDPERARRDVATRLTQPDADLLRRLAYRPFDTRWHWPYPPLCHRPRKPLSALASKPGALTLLTAAQDRGARPWSHFGLVTAVPDNCWLSVRSSCRTRGFPIDPDAQTNPFGDAIGPVSQRTLLAYVLGILAARAYREEFDEALRQALPRIPPPPTTGVLGEVVRHGEVLIAAFTTDLPPETIDAVTARADAHLGSLVLGHEPVLHRWLDARRGASTEGLGHVAASVRAVLRAMEAIDASRVVRELVARGT